MSGNGLPDEASVVAALKGSSRGPLKPKELARALDVVRVLHERGDPAAAAALRRLGPSLLLRFADLPQPA